jgi:trypsin-like peptidase
MIMRDIAPEIASHDLDPLEFWRLVIERARALGIEVKRWSYDSDIEAERKALEQNILEKVHLTDDLLPVQWLAQGAAAAKAVVRVVVPALNAMGTGFVVWDDAILTNNHVLPSVEAAMHGRIDLFYEMGQTPYSAMLEPERLFITNPELDYTFCGYKHICEPDTIRLAANRVTRGERVNIIQHPNGGCKQIAVHDNKVLRVLDTVIRYRTDTMPGSSGAPVFDNEWNLVGLHHAGWMGVCGTATNEAIRIDVILESLSAEDRERLGLEP